MDFSPFVARRTRLLEQMQAGVAVIQTAPECIRNRDTHYAYRFDSYFYYLTGFPEPEAVLVLVAGEAGQSILFCRERDPEREVWEGFRHGPDAARDAFGFDASYPIAGLDEKLPELISNQPAVFYSMGFDAVFDARILNALNRVRSNVRAGVHTPGLIQDVRSMLDEMRLIKDDAEVSIMRRAASISSAAHRRTMSFAAPGRYEYEVEAELLHEFRRSGAYSPAYSSIVAGGANACILHYVDNRDVLADGDLLLIDAGCELEGYASDITRTFPVNGCFSPAQRDVYRLVLDAQRAAIEQVRPGNPWDAPHNAAVGVLAQGMLDLKLLEGSLDGVIESESYKRFYMHRTGHWLGLDVHDAGEYKRGGVWRTLEPGMVMTVEPGCYIRAGEDVPVPFWNIGVRIEDDALVTPAGCEILTEGAPKQIEEIESLQRDASERRRDVC